MLMICESCSGILNQKYDGIYYRKLFSSPGSGSISDKSKKIHPNASVYSKCRTYYHRPLPEIQHFNHNIPWRNEVKYPQITLDEKYSSHIYRAFWRKR
jgi:hypothetical protein